MGSKPQELYCPICKKTRKGVKKNAFSSTSTPCRACTIRKSKREFVIDPLRE